MTVSGAATVAQAELLQFVVQVSHRVLFSYFSGNVLPVARRAVRSERSASVNGVIGFSRSSHLTDRIRHAIGLLVTIFKETQYPRDRLPPLPRYHRQQFSLQFQSRIILEPSFAVTGDALLVPRPPAPFAIADCPEVRVEFQLVAKCSLPHQLDFAQQLVIRGEEHAIGLRDQITRFRVLWIGGKRLAQLGESGNEVSER